MNHIMSRQRQSARWDFLLRARYQILIGGLIAVLLPVAIRALVTDVGFNQPTQYVTAIGGMVALVIGHLSYRRLHVFPGIASGGYIVTSFSISFVLLAAVFFMLRIDYSRIQFLASYILSVSFFLWCHLRFVSARPIVLGVVPNGGTNQLPETPRVLWQRIYTPDVDVPGLQGVVVDLTAEHSDAWNTRIAAFTLAGIPVYHVKEVVEQLTGCVAIDRLSENTLGSLNPNDLYLKMRGLTDGLAALILLVLALPLLLLVGLAIRLDSPGPALFLQQRTGFRAKVFTVYKFRTMRTQLDRVSDDGNARDRAITLQNDPRITKLGRVLRKTRIDELPQLINVLRGEMGLIGPRPEAVALTQWYEKDIPYYHYRHIIKPGLTGWAQINQGHVSNVTDVRRKLNLDFYYVKNFSLWLDMLIILKTINTMITGFGAK